MEKNGIEYDFDIFIIGGGSGGLAASKRASKLGARVGLTDFVNPTPNGTKWGLGGTCVNVGCIPKKLMHYTGLLGEIKNDMYSSGWDIDCEAKHDWQRMINNVSTHIKKINWGYKKQLQKENIKYFNCFGKLIDKNTVSLINKKGKESTVTSKYIVIATGGRPKYYDVPNLKELSITSDDLFWLKNPPGKTLVVGAGYTAIECAGFLRGLGYEVDILLRNKFLKKFDRGMVERIYQDAVNKQINFKTGKITSLSKKSDLIETNFVIYSNADPINGRKKDDIVEETTETVSYNTVLVAVGRTYNTHKLNLREVGVKIKDNNKIPVGDFYQTNIKNIFAIGDIKDRSFELTPIAIKEGIKLAEFLFNKKQRPVPINYNAIATTIFSPLEYAKCGLSEEKAILIYGEDDIEVYHSSFKPLEWNFYEKRENNLCYAKVVICKKKDLVLGVHYAGPNAGEVIQAYSFALIRNTTYKQFKEISKVVCYL
jgi:thioredoxin reductase (NADPH)